MIDVIRTQCSLYTIWNVYPSSVSKRKDCGDGWNNVLSGVQERATNWSSSSSGWTAWISTTNEPSLMVTISETTTADEQIVHSCSISSSTCLLFCPVSLIHSTTESGWADFQQLTVGVCSGDRVLFSPSIVTLSVDIRLFGVNNLKALDDVVRFWLVSRCDMFDWTGDFTSFWVDELTVCSFSDGLTTQWISMQLCNTRYLVSGTPISANFRLNTISKSTPVHGFGTRFRCRWIAQNGQQYLANDSAWKARQKRATTSF